MPKKKVKAKPEIKQKRPCFQCNGTGQMCDSCGEAENVTACEEGGHPSLDKCDSCKGSGIAALDQD